MTPFRLAPWAEGDRLCVLDLDSERGEMVRRGADLILEGVWDLANADVCWRERVLPLSGDKEFMLSRAGWNVELPRLVQSYSVFRSPSVTAPCVKFRVGK